MDLFENSWYFITTCITLLIISASTAFTVWNVVKIWKKGSPKAKSDNDNEISDKEDDDNKQVDDNIADGEVPDIDPMEYCEHIQSEVKKAKFRVAEKKIGETMTAEQIEEEREIQRKQLEEIFKLMQQQDDKFGVGSVEDIQNQMKLYAQ